MEQYQYTFIETNTEEQSVFIPFYLRWLPGKWGDSLKENFIWRKAPVRKKKVENFGMSGLCISLPFSKKQLCDYSRDQITGYIERIISREKVQNIVVSPCLKKFMGSIPHMEGRSLVSFYIEEMLLDLRRKHRISKKDMALIVIDSSETDVSEMLDKIKADLNYLTIVTEHKERYEQFGDTLFAETGLLTQVVSKEEAGYLTGNIILDFRPGGDKFYRNFPDGAVVVELSGNMKKTKDLLVKRKDLAVYNSLDIFSDEEKVNNGLFEVRLNEERNVSKEWGNIRVICSLTLDYL